MPLGTLSPKADLALPPSVLIRKVKRAFSGVTGAGMAGVMGRPFREVNASPRGKLPEASFGRGPVPGFALERPSLYSLRRRAVASRGCSSMVEQQPSKLNTRVRFPSPAPAFAREAREGCRAEALSGAGGLFRELRLRQAASHPAPKPPESLSKSPFSALAKPRSIMHDFGAADP